MHAIQAEEEKMKSIFLSDSDEEDIVDFMKQHEEVFDKTHVKLKDKQRKTLGKQLQLQGIYLSALSISGSTYQIWQAQTDQVRPSCSQEHQEADLVEGQFQLSTRSHQKEGGV